MTKTTKVTITCDYCKLEISPKETCYPHEYILKLSCVDRAIGTGITYSIAMKPLLDEDKYFCGIGCLKVWASNL